MPRKTAYLLFFALLLGSLSFGSETAHDYTYVSVFRDIDSIAFLKIDTTFHYSNTLQLSTDAVVLSGDPSDLADGDAICPGVVTASPTASVDWINYPDYSFSASSAFPGAYWEEPPEMIPGQGYTSPHGIVWDSSLFSDMLDWYADNYWDRLYYTESLYGQIPDGYREEVTYWPYWPGDDAHDDGDSRMTFIGDGDITITASDGGPITRTTPMDDQQPQTFDLSSLGDWTFDSTIGIDAIGVVHQLSNTGDSSHQYKYLYHNVTTGLPHTSDPPASVWITVADPQDLYITLVGTNPSGTVPMSAGQVIPFTIQVTNEDASIVSVNATGATVTPAGFTFTPTGGFDVPIPADSSYVHTLTGDLNVPDPLPSMPVTVTITIHFKSSNMACHDYLEEDIPVSINGIEGMRCELTPNMVSIIVGYTQLFTATCYNPADAVVDCGHLDWTSTAGTMNPASTDTPPDLSESTLTAENIGNLRDVTATSPLNFSCSAVVNVVDNPPVSCDLVPDPAYMSTPSDREQFNATCYNITGDTVYCYSLVWNTTYPSTTMDPWFTMEPPMESKSNLTTTAAVNSIVNATSVLVGGNNFSCSADVLFHGGRNLVPHLTLGSSRLVIGNSTLVSINTTNNGGDTTENESNTTLVILKDTAPYESYIYPVPALDALGSVVEEYNFTCKEEGIYHFIETVDVGTDVYETDEYDNNETRILICTPPGKMECEDYV